MIEADGIPPQWQTHIAVSEIDKTVAATELADGKVIRPAFDVPGVGRIAMLQDPAARPSA